METAKRLEELVQKYQEVSSSYSTNMMIVAFSVAILTVIVGVIISVKYDIDFDDAFPFLILSIAVTSLVSFLIYISVATAPSFYENKITTILKKEKMKYELVEEKTLISFSSSSELKMQGELHGSIFLLSGNISGSMSQSNAPHYRYVVQTKDGVQFENLEDKYSVTEEQVFIQEGEKVKASLKIEKSLFENKEVQQFVEKYYTSEKVLFANSLDFISDTYRKKMEKDKFIFVVPKGTVLTSFQAK